MPLFQQEVIELREVLVVYTVEANTIGEACSKISSGETVKETSIREIGVKDRMPQGDLECLPAGSEVELELDKDEQKRWAELGKKATRQRQADESEDQ